MIKKAIFFTIGVISTILGAIGIIMPVVPTTPLLLLALACFFKSNKKFYYFVLPNQYLSPYVKYHINLYLD